jgi:LmbE family N-acetylglucosaminyl deacetylase|tara:strand:+ start:306 stop:995 length:690 start_codon:yes stop_codon:yes gene_type:complete
MIEEMNDIVLIIVAHPDDEAISMGGTIKKHVEKGDSVYVVSMTDGVGARGKKINDDAVKRNQESKKSSECLGFVWAESYNFSDNAMDSYPLLEIVKCIEKAKNEYNPSLIYTHSGADLNVDHRVVANAVLTAFRPQPNEKCKEIRLFEVASATDYGNEALTGSFTPNLFIDIKETWDAKATALNAYKSEMRDYPHSRSIEGIHNLAKLRGNQVGLIMAEAFQVIRKLDT